LNGQLAAASPTAKAPWTGRARHGPSKAIGKRREGLSTTFEFKEVVGTAQRDLGAQPKVLAETDAAPNPVEYVLAALASCQEITDRLVADNLGIPVDKVSVSLEGDVDLRGFFAVDKGIRPGYGAIRGTVRSDGPASEDDYRRLKAVVDAHCPVPGARHAPEPGPRVHRDRGGAGVGGSIADSLSRSLNLFAPGNSES
jgi:putative redox protein